MMENSVNAECPKHKGQPEIACVECRIAEKNNELVFDILKKDTIVLPPCDSANDKSVVIDTLKPKPKYVWVTYDPLYERVICVHEKAESECKKCKVLRNKRWKTKSPYMPEANKFKIRP